MISVTTLGDRRATTDGLPREIIFELLSNERRRRVLTYLTGHGSRRVELRELVDFVAASEKGEPVAEISQNERKRVYTALQQFHLPKLDESGVIEYDHERGEIELSKAARDVELYLEYVPRDDIPWSHVYIGLSGVMATITAAVWLDIYPFGGVSGHLVAALTVTIFFVSAVFHARHARSCRIGAEEEDTDPP